MSILNERIYWEEWLKLIMETKKNKEEAPVDSLLDTSGFIIPGYNGIRINTIKSLINLESTGKWDEGQIVYEEIEPHVTISNLPPAPVFFGNPKKTMVSFMINVAWGNEYLIEILRLLKENEIKATFFLDGTWTYKYPQLAKRIFEDEHEIASHAYSHPDMRGMTLEGIKWELRQTNQIIQKELGLLPRYFTPPSGEFDERVVYWAAQEGMTTVLSTIDTQDWKKPSPEEIKEKIELNLKNGALILMHPTESTLLALQELIGVVKKKGYKLSTVRQLLSTKRV